MYTINSSGFDILSRDDNYRRRHYGIYVTPNGKYTLDYSDQNHQTLADLVLYYTKVRISLLSCPLSLTY